MALLPSCRRFTVSIVSWSLLLPSLLLTLDAALFTPRLFSVSTTVAGTGSEDERTADEEEKDSDIKVEVEVE